MAVRPEFRWWILTVVAVAILVFISALALDRKNVVWDQGIAHCPHCRAEVLSYGTRCRTCREQYDWVVAQDEESPLSVWSLSALETQFLGERVRALGKAEAIQRVTRSLGIAPEAAKLYLGTVGRGRCGWCGGTGYDLGSSQADSGGGWDADKAAPCPVCFGRKRCIACDGDRHMRVGDEVAHRAYLAYFAELSDLESSSPFSSKSAQRDLVRRLNETFVLRHAGTIETLGLYFWPDWPGPRDRDLHPASLPELVEMANHHQRGAHQEGQALGRARDRLGRVLLTLESE